MKKTPTRAQLQAQLAAVVAEANRLDEEAQQARVARQPDRAKTLEAHARNAYAEQRRLRAIIAAGGAEARCQDEPLVGGYAWSKMR